MPIEHVLAYATFFLDRNIEVNRVNSDNQTALYLAVKHDRRELVELLLARGADVMIPSEDPEKTPLELAERLGHDEIVKLLGS